MKQPSYDEYEEVESPFAARSAAEKSSPRDRLRTRKNVFNRPFATAPSAAPVVVEKKITRRSVGSLEDTDMVEHHQSHLADTEIEYLDEEELDEEVTETRPATRPSSATKKKSKLKKNLLAKTGWAVVTLLVLRLIFMDRGVWDYFSTEGEIREKQQELSSIKAENDSLGKEVSRIQTDRSYQKHLAKEHLGVIAADEFLILFAGESSDSSTDNQI
jgi:cell division protein FtsB